MAYNPRLIDTGSAGSRTQAQAGRRAAFLPALAALAGPAPRRSAGLIHGLLALLAVAAPLSAQAGIGGQGVYRSELLTSGFGIGARADVEIGFIMSGLVLTGVYNRFHEGCEDCDSWEAGGQVTIGDGVSYIGMNTLFSRIDQLEGEEVTETDKWKFSLIVGFRLLNVPVIVPFLEVRQSLGSGLFNDQALSLGIMIAPARPRNAPRPPARRAR